MKVGIQPSHAMENWVTRRPSVAPQHRTPPKGDSFPSSPIEWEGVAHDITKFFFSRVSPRLIGHREQIIKNFKTPLSGSLAGLIQQAPTSDVGRGFGDRTERGIHSDRRGFPERQPEQLRKPRGNLTRTRTWGTNALESMEACTGLMAFARPPDTTQKSYFRGSPVPKQVAHSVATS